MGSLHHSSLLFLASFPSSLSTSFHLNQSFCETGRRCLPLRTLSQRRQKQRHRCRIFAQVQERHSERWRSSQRLRSEDATSDSTLPGMRVDSDTSENSETQYGGSDINGGDRNGSNNRWRRFDPEDDNESGGDLQVPPEIVWGIKSNTISEGVLLRWRELMSKGGWMALLMRWSGFRRRLLADERFFFKLMSQILIGNGTSLIGEIQVRKEDIWDEMEYVAADLIVGTVVEAAFVWILAPMIGMGYYAGKGGGMFGGVGQRMGNVIRGLPANMFEASTSARRFSIAQRIGSFFYAGAQYAIVGIGAGIVGMAITYALIESRKMIDKSYVPKRPMPDLWGSSFGWGAFMAVSSNTRFQIVEGLEQLLARMFAGKAELGLKAAILALRFGNNYWGGVQFVQFFRYLGLHATGESNV